MELKELSPLDEDLLLELGYVKDVDYVIAEFDFDILTVAMIPKVDTEEYHDVYVNEKHELYVKYNIILNDYFYNELFGKLIRILKIKYLRLYPKGQNHLNQYEELSFGTKASVNLCTASEPDLSLIKSYGYENIKYGGSICYVSFPERGNNIVDPIVKYNDAFYIPSKIVSRGLYPDSFNGTDVIYEYERVEYLKMIKKKNVVTSSKVTPNQPLKIIYLNYNSKNTYMNIRSSHRTSNGFKYSCYNDSSIIGPFVNISSFEFDIEDKKTILNIIRSKRSYEVTWEDDDCWAESFQGALKDSIGNIGDLNICSVLNELFSEKYNIEFRPTPTEKEKECSVDFEKLLK